MKKTIGIAFIYAAAVLIMLSILFMFKVLRFRYVYSTAAFGFLLYVIGLFLTREGKFSLYKILMIVISILLIFVALGRELIGI
jgi:hypothetical protein